VKWIDEVLELALERAPESLPESAEGEDVQGIAVPEDDDNASAALKH